MKQKINVPICQNHLTALYEALKRDDTKAVGEIEHHLTQAEQCVACAYVLKFNDGAEEALSRYLNEQGFAVEEKQPQKRQYFAVVFGLVNLTLAIISIGIIAWVNYLVISGWFNQSGPANIGSIEVSYVSMGRFLSDFGFPNFAPFWYFGFPFHIFYTPLLPFLEYLIHTLAGMPLWQTYRLLTGLGYIIAPISLFLLGWQLSRKVVGGLLAGIAYSVLPTVFYFILPSGEVASDRLSEAFWDPRRFTILVRWGEGPHTLSLIFVPLVGVFFAKFLKKRSFLNLLLTAILLVLTGLTNAIGLFAALLLMASMAFVYFVQSKQDKLDTLKSFLILGLISFGLISFWYNLIFISTFFREGSSSGGILSSLFPWGWVGIVLALCLVYFLIKNFIKSFAIATAGLWFMVLFSVVSTYYLSAPPDESYRRLELLPQALRYNIEVDMSLSLLLGVLGAGLVGLFSRKFRFFEVLGFGLSVGVALLAILYIADYIPIAQKQSYQSVDLNLSREKEVATWLSTNADYKKGERVFVPGNYGFYLNYFSNTWQLRGALYQASDNHFPEHIYYQLANGTDPEISSAWFRAANIKYFVITGPSSLELYKEVKNPERFSGFEKVSEEKGDTIYQIPLKNDSPVKVVSIARLKSLVVPKKGDDKKNLLAYTSWIEENLSDSLSFSAINNDTYQINGSVSQGQGILVQMTGGSGWRATDSNGHSVTIKSDPLGFMVLEPMAGLAQIRLHRDKPWQIWLGYFITALTIVVIIGMGVKSAYKKIHG